MKAKKIVTLAMLLSLAGSTSYAAKELDTCSKLPSILKKEALCDADFQDDKYLNWNELSFFERKPDGVNSGYVMTDPNGHIWYVKESGDAKDYIASSILKLIKTETVPGNNFAETKPVEGKENHYASRILPNFKTFNTILQEEGADYQETIDLKQPKGDELALLAMALISVKDVHFGNRGIIHKNGQEEIAIIDYDTSLIPCYEYNWASKVSFEDEEQRKSSLARQKELFPSITIEGLQKAAAVIAEISPEDIIETIDQCLNNLAELGFSAIRRPYNLSRLKETLLIRLEAITYLAEILQDAEEFGANPRAYGAEVKISDDDEYFEIKDSHRKSILSGTLFQILLNYLLIEMVF